MSSGFKNTTRMRSGFNFSQGAGFTGSSGKVQNISSYARKVPERARFAKGGAVDSSLHSFKDDSALNQLHGPTGGLRPGFTRGGRATKYAEGGPAKKPPKVPPKAPPPPKSTAEILRSGRKEQMAELGIKRGGAVKHYAKGGLIPADKAAKRALKMHVAAPAPKGHKGLKGC